MLTASLVLVAATLGVDYGWTSDGQGGRIYIIQIEPQLLEAMREGTVIASEIPPSLEGVRAFRILVGDELLVVDVEDRRSESVTAHRNPDRPYSTPTDLIPVDQRER